MNPKTVMISGLSVPLEINDVDTDLIIPAQYLTSVSKSGYGEHLFTRLKENDPDCVFNQEKFKHASILITAHNFGCGSSREHAVWAIQQAGFKAIIAVSFADIFYGNSAKNGLLLIKLSENMIKNMLEKAQSGNYQINIDLENQQIKTSLSEKFDFEMDPFRKHCLINHLDDLDYLLSHQKEIKTYFESKACENYVQH